ANSQAAHRSFEAFRKTFHARELGDLPKYSFSAGISELGLDGGDPIELLSRADLRLYEAKRLGRDRTISSAVPEPGVNPDPSIPGPGA
nr:hypothetical protein [Deltaproteobacteria bacterium]